MIGKGAGEVKPIFDLKKPRKQGVLKIPHHRAFPVISL
jgi:hypothetical protein